ncbi:pyruvate, phosphate dikinase [Aminobacterium mobile]|jgi:pyruvate,orthophosphate dikinase|uniref:pyruvate, phosphate dikinase n=1 Tax=Aminobacterium mobile TaxID=81467 RepID=UPI000463887E|nr:pyruvate, phosphate dikinase [Aminobacterium mobile]
MRDEVKRKFVYDFEEGDAAMTNLLGGKGANLAQMVRNGLRVPPGFIITTQACLSYLQEGEKLLEDIWPSIREALSRLEVKTGKKWGKGPFPLLVSVRSGAPVSMPGMMDTILNLGLNSETLPLLSHASQNERFAFDSYRRFIQMYAEVVKGLASASFEEILAEVKAREKIQFDYEISTDGMRSVVSAFLAIYEAKVGEPFPQDPWEQLRQAIAAVFRSWNSSRAITYRELNSIPHTLGTAVNVVSMVFGNLGEQCGTGVCFTRNPSNGCPDLYGEFLINAQGEDVVAGVRTPLPISELRYVMPDMHEELLGVAHSLENYYKDMQDVEFTIENRRLYILQTREGKRSAAAAVKIAHDMVREQIINRQEALKRVTPRDAELLLHKQVPSDVHVSLLAEGLPASPGAGKGIITFTPDEAVRLTSEGQKVVLVRPETSPDDIHGLAVAEAVVTSRGGMTSHAAVVARGMGKPCVTGCESLSINIEQGILQKGDIVLSAGDFITVDGSYGRVLLGDVPLVDAQITAEFSEMLQWADNVASLQVWANADTPLDAKRAREFGAKGIGLCRTEHMFMSQERLPIMERMIVAESKEKRLSDLELLKAMQKEDFRAIFTEMDGYPVIIRLLDPPLHEFLPKEGDIKKRILELPTDMEEKERLFREEELIDMLKKIESLKEVNPMMGFRGCRVGIIYPEIYEMQIRAILEAAIEAQKNGVTVIPEIMIPLVGISGEMEFFRHTVDRIAQEYYKSTGASIDYKVGSMIEVPRAILITEKIALYADFFSFGTNDLTQAVFAYSRDDAESKFLGAYLEKELLTENPFHILDREGVGEMMHFCVDKARKTRQNISLGICGEHGGNPESIAFCHALGLDYVSCSPFRIPVARLAAAQAALGFTN